MNRIWLIGLAGFATLVVGAAQAQISGKNGPIDITSDHFSANNPGNEATYEGNVEALQDGNRLRSDLLNIYFKPRSATPDPKPAPAAAGGAGGPMPVSSKIDHMEAIGNVYFVTPTQVIRGDKAVYTKDSDTIVVTGQVVMTQGQDVMRGTRLVYNHTTGKSTMENEGGRVQSVIYQDKKTPGA